ncbi:hypothetical protein N0V86_003089 [Didymella sp. IMI 355093]|nr:hypothetical protein N0V86_003089 [Didymella sp. IMI 355093]
MSLTSGSTEQDHEDSLEFPDEVPLDVEVDLPFPSNNHIQWTSVSYTNIDIPPTFDDDVTLPDHDDEPVLYAAAVDTIRMTNRWFELAGSYSSERSRRYPLTERLLRQKAENWRNRKKEDGKPADALFPEEGYYDPPDRRTLFVKRELGDPTDDKLPSLWITACHDVNRMSDLTWEQYLGYTREQLIDRAETRVNKSEGWLVLEIFKRYLVWRELFEGQSKRARRFQERQPTWAELEEFFSREHVKQNGATFIDICHEFPHARDYVMLVYRIEHFATLEEQKPVVTKHGVDDPVESRYMPQPRPSEEEIESVVYDLLDRDGCASLRYMADQHWPIRVHDALVRAAFDTLDAHPDVTTGNYFLAVKSPTREEILDVVLNLLPSPYVNGFGLQELAGYFPNRVHDLEGFHRTFSDLIYHDTAEQRYFPLYQHSDTGAMISREASMMTRDRARLRMSTGSNGTLIWDRDQQQYTPRYPPNPHLGMFGSIREPTVDPGSHTESLAPTDDPASPPPQPVNALSEITGWGFAPVDSGAASPRAIAPVAEIAPAAPAPSEPGKKRGRDGETDEPQGKNKKPKKAPKVKCSRQTLKGTRCKNTKGAEDGEVEWDCGRHTKG